jgi:uncharacterized repeat protein (TIGR01451 family)
MSTSFTRWQGRRFNTPMSIFLIFALLIPMISFRRSDAANRDYTFLQADNDSRARAAQIVYTLQNMSNPVERMKAVMLIDRAISMRLDLSPLSEKKDILLRLDQDFVNGASGQTYKNRFLRWGTETLPELGSEIAGSGGRGITTKLLLQGLTALWKPALERTEQKDGLNYLKGYEIYNKGVWIHELPKQAEALLANSNNSSNKALFDFVMGMLRIDVQASDKAADITARNPHIREAFAQLGIATDGHSFTTNGAAIEMATTAIYRDTNAVTDELRTFLQQIAQDQTDIKKWIDDEGTRAAAEEQARILAEQSQIKIAAAQSSIYILSTLADKIDPKLAHDISIVGNAGLQIADAHKEFSRAVAAFAKTGQLSTGQFFGSVIASGNILGASMAIFSLFSKKGMTPEGATLAQIAALRQQIAQLRQEMHARFDLIDKRLDAIYNRLDAIWSKLSEISDKLDAVRQELYDLQSRLTSLEQKLTAYLQDGFRQNLILGMNGKLNYAQTYGYDMPFQPDYVDGENLFYTWSTEISRHSYEAGAPSGARSTRPEDIYSELVGSNPDGSVDLDRNLNYLSDMNNGQRLANPRTWALSSQAYMQLALEWPQHDQRISLARLDRIYQTGNELDDALRSLTLVQTPNGANANYGLYDRLIANYDERYAGLDGFLAEKERAVENQYKLENHINPRIDLWAASNQTFPEQSDYEQVVRPYTVLPVCQSGDNTPFDAPRNMISYTNPNYIRAQALNLGSLRECVRQWNWVDATSEWWRDAGGNVICQTPLACFVNVKANLLLQLDVIYRDGSGETVVNRRNLNSSVTGATFCSGRTLVRNPNTSQPPPPPPSDFVSLVQICHNYPDWILRDNWTTGWNFRNLFEQASTDATPDHGALLAAVTAHVKGSITSHQQAMYTRVVQAFPSSADFADAGKQFAGAKTLLDAFIQLGFPHVVEWDDYMRAFLDGTQRVYDRDLVWAEYRAKATQFPSLSRSVRDELRSIKDQRIHDLRMLLHSYLDAIQAGQYSESHPLIATTLLQLDMLKKARQQPLLTADVSVDMTQSWRWQGAWYVKYMINITNVGPDAATDVRIMDTLPTGLDVVSATTTLGSCTPADSSIPLSLDRQLTCKIDRLEPQGGSNRATVTVIAVPNTETSFSNSVAVSSSEADPRITNNRGSLDLAPNTKPAVSLGLTALNFTAQLVETTSTARTVTLTNSGTALLEIDSVRGSGDFAQTTTCGAALAAGASCTISVTFTPTAVGNRTGNLTIISSAMGSPHQVKLSGVGIALQDAPLHKIYLPIIRR